LAQLANTNRLKNIKIGFLKKTGIKWLLKL
jgi:hypothetical protein